MYWPEFRTLQHEFSIIVSKLSKVLSALTSGQFDSLLVYVRERLNPTVNGCLPTGQPANLPKGSVTPSALLQHVHNRWDYLNTDLIEDVIQHITAAGCVVRGITGLLGFPLQGLVSQVQGGGGAGVHLCMMHDG